MKREYTLWLVVMAIAVHILEEFAMDFIGWAQTALAISVSWESFHMINACIILFAIGGAMIGWRMPEVSLIAPALVLINAALFHVGLTLVQMRYSPGALSAALVFIPVGLFTYYGAYKDGVLTRRAVSISVLGGVLWHVYLIVLFPLRSYLMR